MVASKQIAVPWDEISWPDRLETLHQIAKEAAHINGFRLRVVNQILKPAGVKPRDHVGQARAIYQWAKKNIYYVNEAGEHLQHPLVTFDEEAGDCDDYSLFMAAAAHSIGLPYRFVLSGPGWESRTARDMPDDPEHIHVEIGTPALAEIDDSASKLNIRVTYRSADATDVRGRFADRVTLSGAGMLPTLRRSATVWFVLGVLVTLAITSTIITRSSR